MDTVKVDSIGQGGDPLYIVCLKMHTVDTWCTPSMVNMYTETRLLVLMLPYLSQILRQIQA